eukprot:9350996-Pyramimonas_sp.AAC.1
MGGNLEKLESSCQALFGLDEHRELSAQEKEEAEKRTKASSDGIESIGQQLFGTIKGKTEKLRAEHQQMLTRLERKRRKGGDGEA